MAPQVTTSHYRVEARSVVVLFALQTNEDMPNTHQP
jgi:hypothetical protein